MLFDKSFFGWLSVVFIIVSILPYYYLIYQRRVKPHLFSWLIWTIVLGIGFVAGRHETSGPGAWSTGVACFNCFTVSMIAFRKGEHRYTRSDVACLTGALTAIPVWYATNNPLWSVIMITMIDVLAFYPTMRKSYHKPYEEGVFTFLMAGLSYAIALLGIENWTPATWLYSLSMAFTCFMLVTLLIVRRSIIRDQSVS